MSATNANIFEQAKCVGQWWLFDSTSEHAHDRAKKLCMECPAFAACLRRRDAMLTSTTAGTFAEGTWAGELLGHKGARDVA